MSPRPRASHHARNCPTARPYAARVLAFAIRAAKNSRKRSTAAGPASTITAGSTTAPPGLVISGRATVGIRASLIRTPLPCRRAFRSARSRCVSAWASAKSRATASCAPEKRTSIRSRATLTPSGRLASRPSSASTGTATRIPVSRAVRSSVRSRSRRSASPRKAARARCFRSWRRSCVLGSVLWLPVSSAPKVCMSVAARALETPKSCSTSPRVSNSRSSASSWRMASGMARSHRGGAGIGERRVGYNPCGERELGRCMARMLYSRLVDGRPLHKIPGGRGEGPIKRVMGRRERRRTQRRHRGPRRAQRAARSPAPARTRTGPARDAGGRTPAPLPCSRSLTWPPHV